MPLYIRELGVTDPGRIAMWSGLIAAATPAISGVLGPLFGRLADRFGRKLMLIRSLVGFVVIVAVMGLVTSVEQLFLARLIQGLFAGFTPMAMALASVSAPRDKVPVAISIVQSAQLLSVAVGPAAGGYVASHHGIRAAFFVTAGMCAVALVALIFLFQEVSASGKPMARGAAARLPMRQALRYPNFLLVLTLLLIAQFIDRGLALLIPLHVAHMPELTAIAAVGATVSSNLSARLARGIPTTRLLMIGLLAGGPLCALMALAHGWAALLVLRTLVAFCFGGAITLAYALGAEIVPPEHRGAAFGWLALGVQVGTATSPLAMGALAAWSIPGAYVFDGAIALTGAALLAFRWSRPMPATLRDVRP
jgi:MFS family permease